MLRLAWFAFPVLLVATPAAADPPDPDPRALRGMPATYEAWREERDVVRARVRDAERAVEAAEDRGDEAAEERAERELDAAKEAHAEFRDATTSRDAAMMVGGILLCTGGVASLALGTMVLVGDNNGARSIDDNGSSVASVVAWQVPTWVAIGTGAAFITVGSRKRWRGADPVEPTVGVGPGTVSVRGTF